MFSPLFFFFFKISIFQLTQNAATQFVFIITPPSLHLYTGSPFITRRMFNILLNIYKFLHESGLYIEYCIFYSTRQHQETPHILTPKHVCKGGGVDRLEQGLFL